MNRRHFLSLLGSAAATPMLPPALPKIGEISTAAATIDGPYFFVSDHTVDALRYGLSIVFERPSRGKSQAVDLVDFFDMRFAPNDEGPKVTKNEDGFVMEWNLVWLDECAEEPA